LVEGSLSLFTRKPSKVELSRRRIPFQSQERLFIRYKGQTLKKEYAPDLILFGQIIAELKVLDRLTGTEEAQLLNYLKATGMRVGLLLNFGSRVRLEWKRYVM
jgi:GxxExxY protein